VVEESEGGTDHRIARGREPTGVISWQAVHVAPQRLDEERFGDLGQQRHTVFNLCTTGPWSRVLCTLPQNRSGLDPFNLLTILVGIVAVGVVLTTDPRTLTCGRWPSRANPEPSRRVAR
jgi:hypothetical protein